MLKRKQLHSWMIKLGGGLLAAALVSGLALAPAYAAAPAGGGPDRLPLPTPPASVNQALTAILQREQSWLSVQTNTLADANTIAAHMEKVGKGDRSTSSPSELPQGDPCKGVGGPRWHQPSPAGGI